MITLSLNIRSAHKSLRPAHRKSHANASTDTPARESRTERARRKQIREEVANWVVLVCVLLLEKLADRTVAWVVPLYSTVKALILVTVLCWRGKGSLMVFDKVIKPFVRPYERPLDLVGFVLGEVLDIAFAAVLFLPRWATRVFQGRKKEPDVPSILRGLRQISQPRLAKSLADSIERAQDDSDAISARFSQPVQVKINPVAFRPQRPPPARPPKVPRVGPSAPQPTPTAPVEDLPLPPASSTARFRPVTVLPPASKPPAFRPWSQTVPSSVASTSRLPVPRAAPAVAAPIASLYPSLAGMSSPLPPPPQRVPLMEPSTLTRTVGEPVIAHLSRAKGKARAREPADAAPDAAPAPAPKRSRTSRRSSRVETEAPQAREEPKPREATPPPPSAVVQVPPTPAPPGAFAFAFTSTSARAIVDVSGDEGDTMDVDTPQPAESESEPTPRRRSARQSAASTPQAGTSSKKRARTSGAAAATRDRAEEPIATSKEGKAAKDAPGTPRQRALGAIAQLSQDLLGESEPDAAPLLRKKSGRGVLARSTLGRSVGPGAPVAARATRATRRTAADDDDEYIAEDVPPKISPRKRKASRVRDDGAEGSDGPPAAKAGKGVQSASRARAAAKPLAASRLAAGEAATLGRSRSRIALSASTSASGAASTSSTPAAPPPQRRARRVLLGRAGAAMPEEEEEVDGVPVVRRRAGR